jgi:hypothetical protein
MDKRIRLINLGSCDWLCYQWLLHCRDILPDQVSIMDALSDGVGEAMRGGHAALGPWLI